MIGKIFITSSGYDPERGRHVNDPYLGPIPTLGACRPDIRKLLGRGDHIFVISGKVYGFDQFVMGGFEIASKINVGEAYERFPEHRLRELKDGQLTGNIIINADGVQHELDNHSSFSKRIQDYVVGRNLIALQTPDEIAQGRKETLEVLRDVLHKKGSSPIQVVGRWGSRLTEEQIAQLRQWLSAITKRPKLSTPI